MKISRKSGRDSIVSFDRTKKNKGSTKNQITHQIDAEIGYNNISQNIAEVNSNYTPDKVKLINY